MPTREQLHWEHIRQDALMRGVRKEMVRNREEDRVRQKDWLAGDPEDPESWDEIEAPQYERVMPRGEQERRRTNLKRARVRNRAEEEPADAGAVEIDAPYAAEDWRELIARENAEPSAKEHEGAQRPEGAHGLSYSRSNGSGSTKGWADLPAQAGEGGETQNPGARPADTGGHNGAGSSAAHPATGGRSALLQAGAGPEGPGPSGGRNGAGSSASRPAAGGAIAPPQPGAGPAGPGPSGGRNGAGTGTGQGAALPAVTRPGLSKPGAARPADMGAGRPGRGYAPGQAAGAQDGAGSATAYPRPAYTPTRRRTLAVEPLPPGYGLVVEAGNGVFRVEMDGQMLLCTLRGSLTAGEIGMTNVLAAGDRVKVTAAEGGRGVVEAVQTRRTTLARPDVFNAHVRQVLAANVDQLLAVAAYENPPLWPELIDRYLITAELNGLAPVICLNKVDLAEDMAEAREAVGPYLALGYSVIFTSAQTGYGVDALRAALAGRATVLAGLSGVGKSSLLSAVQPGLNLRVLEVNEHQRLGRHTTTGAALHRLSSGGFVVDTPGIKEWGLAGLSRRELGSYYPEIASLAGRCRFGDCSHVEEPGCAVKAAVRSGRMAQVRYDNYRKIYVTLRE